MSSPTPWVGYAVAVAATAVAALARFAYDQRFGPEPAFLIPFLVPVALAGWFAGLWCGLFTTALNTWLIAYTFTEPDTSLSIANANDIVRVIVFVTAAVSMSLITHQLHRHRWRAEEHARVARDRQADLEREVARRQDAERLLEVRVAERTAEVEGQRRLLDAILDALPNAVIIKDATGRITRKNRACEGAFGSSPWTESIADAVEWVGYWPDTGRRVEPHEWPLSRALLRGEVCPGEVVELERFGDRSRRAFLCTAAPVYGPAGEIVAGVVAALDVTDRRRAEQALRESEERFRAFMAHAPFAAWIADADSRGLYTNAAFDRQTGLPAGAYLGKTPADVWPAEFAREYVENNRRVLAGGAAVEAEEPFVRPDGSRGVSHVIKFSVTGASFEPLIGGIAIDMTAAKTAEVALRESERFTREVLDALPAQIAVVDRAGAITAVNRAWERAAGGHPDAAPPAARRGVGVSYLAACEDSAALGCTEAAEAAAAIRRAVAGSGSCDGLEYECHDPTGRQWFSMTVTPLAGPAGGAVVAHIDITARRRAEEEAREGHEKFRLAFEHAPIGVSLTGTDGGWLQVNRSLCEFTGYTEAELLASDFQAITHPDDLGNDLDHLHRFLSGEVATYQTEKRYFHKRGHLIHVHASVSMVRDGGGRPAYFVCHITDITARKEAEAALRESEDRFRTAFDHAPIGMALVAPDGHWLRVNRRLCEIVGYAEAELLATDFQAVTHPDDLNADLDLRRRVLAGDIPRYELEKRYVHRAGHPVEVLVAVSLVRDAAGRPHYFISQVKDVSERRTAQRALAASESLLRQFITHSPAAIAMFDREVRYLQASDRWLADFGLAGRTVIGRSHYELFPDLPDRWKAVHRRVLGGAVESCEEDTFRRADGSTDLLRWECRPWHTATGEVGGLIMFGLITTERKRAEERLRASEERFRAIFDQTVQLVGLLRPDGTVLEANRTALEVGGVAPEDAIGRPFWETPWIAGDPARQARMREAVSRAAEGETVRFETRFRAAGGAEPWADFSLKPCFDAEGRVSLLIPEGRDITARKLAEDALRASEERFRVLFERSSDAHLIFTEAGGITDCNPAAVATLRCRDKSEVLALHPAVLSPEFQPDGRRSLEKCVEMDAAARRTGHHRFDWDHRRSDGEVFPCEVTLTPVALDGGSALLAVWHDLTERKRAEQALRESEERFRAAMQGSLDAVFFLTAERAEGGGITDFRFTELNRRGAALVARPREEVLGQRLCEMLPVNRTGGFFDRYVRVVETGEPLEEEFALDPASGLSATRLRHQVVKVGDGVAVTTQDITARKRAEEQVLASLKEKEVLLKEIHHRVKNNLQIISSLLHLQSAGLPDRAVRGLFEECRGRVKSMALVHERLYRSGDLAGVDLAEYARQLAADLFRAYRVSHESVRLDLDVSVPPLPIDVAIPCGLLLNEMISNCLKHAFQGRAAGVVGVSFRRVRGDVVLSVADDGPGFPPGFDFRTSPSFGLQLIHTLAEQLNGHAALTGGPGATVAVTFPAPKEVPR